MQSAAHAEVEGDRCGISLEKSKATHPSVLAWQIPCIEESGRPVHGVVKLDMAEWLNNNNLNANDIFHRNRTILRWVRNHKGPRIAKANLKKENKLEASHFWTSHYITKLP